MSVPTCCWCSKPCAWVVSCETICSEHYETFLRALDYINRVCPVLLPDDAFDGVQDGWIAPYDPTQTFDSDDDSDGEAEVMEVDGWPYSDEVPLVRRD